MTRDECTARLNRMISGDDAVDLALARCCASDLSALSCHPRSVEMGGELVKSLEALELRLIHDMPLTMATKLRVEADAALALLLALADLEPQVQLAEREGKHCVDEDPTVQVA